MENGNAPPAAQDQQVPDQVQAEPDLMDVDFQDQDEAQQQPDQDQVMVPDQATPEPLVDDNSLVLGPVQPDSDVVPRGRGRKRKVPVVGVPAVARPPPMEGPNKLSTEVMKQNFVSYDQLMASSMIRVPKKSENPFAKPMRSFRGATLNPNLLNIAGRPLSE